MKWSVLTWIAVAVAGTEASTIALTGLRGLKADEDSGFASLDFNIYRGNSRRDLARLDPSPARVVEKRSKRDGSILLELENMSTFYLATLKIGSEQEENGVLIDTGSSDLWVMSHSLSCVAVSSSGAKRDSMGAFAYSESDIEKRNEQMTREIENFKREEANNGVKRSELLFPPSKIEEAVPPVKKDIKIDALVVPTETELATNVHNKDSFESIIASVESAFGGGLGSFTVVTTVVSRTASATVAATATDATASGGSNTCTSYGSFNTDESTSFKKNTTASAFNIQYADNTEADGLWGYDTVILGNATIKNLSFAVVNTTSSDVGVLGIGLSGLETTYSRSGGGSYQYENLPLKMRSLGLINKAAYSLYLASSEEQTGSILFGAVDHAKYSGTLTTVPIINTQQDLGYDTAIRLEIVLDSISLSSSSSNVSVTTNSYAALLDTGSTLSYFPTALLTKFASILGATYSKSAGAYLMKCDVGSAAVLLNFSGKVITVPLANMLLPFSSSGSQCYLGVLGQTSDYILFGDNVLRSIYTVFDLDDLEISLAQINYSNDTDIQLISSSVPSAVRAVSYSATSLYSGVESSATSTASIGSTGKKSDATKVGSSFVLAMALAGAGLIGCM